MCERMYVCERMCACVSVCVCNCERVRVCVRACAQWRGVAAVPEPSMTQQGGQAPHQGPHQGACPKGVLCPPWQPVQATSPPHLNDAVQLVHGAVAGEDGFPEQQLP